jgi:hypothetical protein
MGSDLGMVGPLGAFAPGFSAGLVAQGYRPGSAAAQLQLMADVSVWLAARGLGCGLSEVRGHQVAGAVAVPARGG